MTSSQFGEITQRPAFGKLLIKWINVSSLESPHPPRFISALEIAGNINKVKIDRSPKGKIKRAIAGMAKIFTKGPIVDI